jgi:hypothetical protein
VQIFGGGGGGGGSSSSSSSGRFINMQHVECTWLYLIRIAYILLNAI